MKTIGLLLFIAGAFVSLFAVVTDQSLNPVLATIGFLLPLVGAAILVLKDRRQNRSQSFEQNWTKLVSENPKAKRALDTRFYDRFGWYYPLSFWRVTSCYLVFAPVLGFAFGVAIFVLAGLVADSRFIFAGMSFGSSMGIFFVIGEIVYRKVYRLPTWDEFCSVDGNVERE